MTCIVGLVDKKTIYMGGDSAGVAGLSLTIRADEKVFINGPFIMGFTTSFRMGQLLRYKLDPPKQTNSKSDMEYLVTDFISSVQSCFRDNSFSGGGEFLVGYNGNLYKIYSDFQVAVPTMSFDAVGCGEFLAKGAMSVLKGKPEDRIRKALEVASKFNCGVAPPFFILKK